MRTVLLTPSARRDVHQIWDYIAQDSIDAADRVNDTILAEIQRVAEFPQIGHTHKDIDNRYKV